MSRQVSPRARRSHDAVAVASAEVEIFLVVVSHPDLDQPMKFSSHDTTQISIDPDIWGTHSTWWPHDLGGVDDGPFYFAGIDVFPPGDSEDGPAEARILIQPLTAEIPKALRSTILPIRVDIATVLAATPDLVEAEALDLRLAMADIDPGLIVLSIGREEMEAESWPSNRMTKHSHPVLHR